MGVPCGRAPPAAAIVAVSTIATLGITAGAQQLQLIRGHVERGPGLPLLILVLASFQPAINIDLLAFDQAPD